MFLPRPYQIAGCDFLAQRDKALLADEMRVGKSAQAILAAIKRGARRIVVVAPAIAGPHWCRELPKWGYTGDVVLLDGEGSLPRSGAIVASYEMATRRQALLRGYRPDVFIPDECHFARNPDALRTKMVYGRMGVAHAAGATWALSGTPAPKHAGDLWAILYAFGATKQKYADFVNHFCWIKPGLGARIGGTKERAIPVLREMLAKFMLRRTRRDVAPEMPDIDFQFIEVTGSLAAAPDDPLGTMTDEEALQYVEAHAGSDAEYRIACAMAKVPALVDNITFAIENDLIPQTIVFGHFREPLAAAASRLQAKGITAQVLNGDTPKARREFIQREFMAGRLKVVVANILAAGTAIDLSAARHAYVLEMDWVPANNVQAVNRMVNMEKLDKVTADVVVWPGSSDERVMRVLTRRVQELSKIFA